MYCRPIAVDLFSGAGGLSLGFEQAGFDVVAAVEVDPIHCATHKFNFPECTVIPRSVEALTGLDIRKASGIGCKPVDLVFGGPPCQGFSLIGKRALDDPRNNLVRHFLRLVTELSASYFLFENVKGLTLGRHRQFLQELVSEFSRAGYRIRLPWRVLNAAQYGVPQNRERLFIMGAKSGLPLPNYPDAITMPCGKKFAMTLFPSGPSCRDALGDIPDAERFPELAVDDSVIADAWGTPSPYAAGLRCIAPDAWHFGHPRIWEPRRLTSSATTKHTDISRRRFANTKSGEVEPISRFFRLDADGICNTLRAGTDSSRGAFTSPRPIHYEYNRCITVREMARLHGFPDWFRFHRTKWHGARQVGNSVPPPLARMLAAQYIAAMGNVGQRPDVDIELGDPLLLGLDMSAAARFWGVDVTIGKRDRKSGARKRSQADTEAGIGLARGI
ncbi:DNA cytosine methyltransferase [uncultured Thiodictyon sp.]|uniref:DNA cytosine methyltransferase n=1 Tax=uncultured Thiodictyon sp. TaxID=1846217 RepID=UPI0025CCADDA|nr:DNA cytosine methyltransferase [uncultured Thiodictyon sp.]